MSHRILVVEDEKEIADTLHYALTSEGMVAEWVASGAAAKDALQQKFDLCILDVGLPDCNGFELLKAVRQDAGVNQDTPVIFLTARSEEIDRIIGLEIGADDYVCKPFSPREVVTRVKVILKRAGKQQDHSNQPPDSIGPFEHKPEQRLISYEQSNLDLTRAEYTLMTTFLSQPNRVFSRRQLIESIWSSNHPSDDRAIDTHIKTLRAKLKSSNVHKEYILTHRGFGYSFEL